LCKQEAYVRDSKWSGDGCSGEVVDQRENGGIRFVLCECNHLTEFSVALTEVDTETEDLGFLLIILIPIVIIIAIVVALLVCRGKKKPVVAKKNVEAYNWDSVEMAESDTTTTLDSSVLTIHAINKIIKDPETITV